MTLEPHRYSIGRDHLIKRCREKISIRLILGVAASAAIGISLYVRHWRTRNLESIESLTRLPSGREDLLELMERTGLMGKSGSKSVKEELDEIRKWHVDHGYKGGLVLRELMQPLYTDSSGIIQGIEDFVYDPMHLARRECYYLYYEITGTGQVKQQIFCRGTTLLIDILTCFSFWMVYDAELKCRVHLGFRNQADRILQDITPLLAPASDQRTTVEVSGHSLGGAVAFIISAKLRKRGYQVIRATAIASPRFCATESSSETIGLLLPSNNLRVESDIDCVPFLPFFGCHTGNKLYLVDKGTKVLYVPACDPSLLWLDSMFLNCRMFEIFSAIGKAHRVPYHISHIKHSLMTNEQLHQ